MPARLGERREARQLVGALDQPAGLRHRGGLPLGERGLGRPAALAGAEAGLLGGGRARVERDVLAPRQPRAARGPAIDPGGAHRIVERAVRRAVAALHRLPARRRRSRKPPWFVARSARIGSSFLIASAVIIMLLRIATGNPSSARIFGQAPAGKHFAPCCRIGKFEAPRQDAPRSLSPFFRLPFFRGRGSRLRGSAPRAPHVRGSTPSPRPSPREERERERWRSAVWPLIPAPHPAHCQPAP